MANPPIRLPLQTGKRYSTTDLLNKGKLSETDKQKILADEAAAKAAVQIDPAGVDAYIDEFFKKDEAGITPAALIDPSKDPVVFDESKVEKIEDLSADRRKALEEKLAAFEQLGGAFTSPLLRNVPGMDEALAAREPEQPETIQNTTILEEPTAATSTGLVAEVKSCPRCNWDLKRTDVLDVTIEDKRAWLLSLYGARYKKAYLLSGGHIRIVFRGLTQEESTLVNDQTALDTQNKPNANFELFLTTLFKYRMALSLESIEFENGKKLVVPVDQLLGGRASQGSAVQAVLAYVQKHVLVTESLSRIVGRQFQLFQRTLEWMEENVDNEDFFEEIRGSH